MGWKVSSKGICNGALGLEGGVEADSSPVQSKVELPFLIWSGV